MTECNVSWKAWEHETQRSLSLSLCMLDLCVMLYHTTQLPLCVTNCLLTIHFRSIMESHANEYELKHLQIHSCLILSFFLSPGSTVISSSSWFTAMRLGLARWGLHMLRRSRLLMMAFIVLQRLL